MKRKNLSKKIRFDVFKRDSFCCQYCGQTPPSVVLEVDHINPVAAGGTDEIDNLTTSCFDCNRGKSDGLLQNVPQTVRQKAELLREKELQLSELKKILKKQRARENEDIASIEAVFKRYFPQKEFTDQFRDSIRNNFLRFIQVDDLERAMDKSCSYIRDPGRATKYFCGICWKWRKEGVTHGKG